MKKLLIALCVLCVCAVSLRAQTQQIYVTADHTITLGPFTTPARAPATGETVVTLTDPQYATLDAFRIANPTAQSFAFDGTSFTVPPLEQLRLSLLSTYAALTPAEQLYFKTQFEAVKTRLAKGDVAGVKFIITQALNSAGLPTDLTTAGTTMLGAITTLYGATPPAVND